jgi:hypothetical protein
VLADGGALIEGCTAGSDGGGVYTTAGLRFGAGAGAVRLIRNAADGSGGGVMASGIAAWLSLGAGQSAVVADNTAGADGGGLGFEEGATVSVGEEGCPAVGCSPELVGNGVCDGVCMHRGCNW